MPQIYGPWLSNNAVTTSASFPPTITVAGRLRIHVGQGSLNLLERALLRRLIRTPTHQLRPMAKPVTGDMVEPYLNDEFGPQWLPFATSFSAPAAWTTGSFSGEAGCLPQSLKPLGQACPFFVGNGGS